MYVADYEFIELIYQSDKFATYRGYRVRDNCPVILKLLKTEYPSVPDIAQLKYEYDLINDLDIDGVIRPYGFEQVGRDPLLIMEGFGGITLQDFIANHLIDLSTFLKIAIQLADTLGQLHLRNIVYKNIKPDTILYDPTTGKIKLIDFSLASRLAQENPTVSNLVVLEGSLAYASPEQTGRMNRTVDYRTDFYSLGVTFYKLLTGQLPFQATDLMELVHAHLAKEPRPIAEFNLEIPQVLSAIVLKLMAKTAEDRYQSALGLKADLEHCLNQWQTAGIIETFTPGLHDISDRFQIPQKLYGREREIETLLAVFERIGTLSNPSSTASTNYPAGESELMLVSGYSGIGKSALVNEVHKSIIRQKGYFVSGKFDQFQRNIPYRAILLAFQELVRQLLVESEPQVATWQARLSQALGLNGQVIIEVIPEVELIIGPQPPVPELPPAERQNRFNLVFEHFIQVFTHKSQPLVVFLDDLQWADSATLNLLETLMTKRSIRHLLVIGAYRDNEVTVAHPLLLSLTEIAKSGAKVNHITLGPLNIFHLTQFVADTLKSESDQARPLAELILSKTDGNPFFVIQFLKSLYQENLLEFDYDRGRWVFDLDRIYHQDMTDNVVTLMAGKIRNLATQTQVVTKLAACIGNRFDLATLAIVNQKSVRQTATDLWPAVQEGLILPLDGLHEYMQEDDQASMPKLAYRFLHDRVQQAAYTLIPDEQKKAVHLKVGQLMWQHSNEADLEENLFDIVNHLNIGAELITDPAIRIDLARLNLRAGQKAKSSTAYRPALTYYKMGLSLLGKQGWSSYYYKLSFALYRDLAECEYLCGNFEQAEEDFDLLLGQARTNLEKAEIHNLRIIQYENMAKYAEAVQSGQAGLGPFGLCLPKTDAEKKLAFEAEMDLIRASLGDKQIEELAQLPVMTRPEMKMSMKLLMTVWAPAYIAGDVYLPALLSATMVRLSLAYGNSEESAYAYMTHGITVGSVLGDYKAGYEFGKLALKVNEQFDDRKLKAKVHHMFSCFVNLWRMPLSSCFPYSKEAYRSGLETGDFVYATYGIFHESWYALLCGQELSHFQQAYRPNLSFLSQIKNQSFVDAQHIILQWGLNLQGLTGSKYSLSDQDFDEQAYIESYQGNPFFETFYFVVKLHILYTFGNYREAHIVAKKAASVVHSLNGTIWTVVLCFYHALTLTALYSGASRKKRQTYWQTLTDLETKMEIWANNCPENFQHRILLIAAEMAKIRGRPVQAMTLYEQAIQCAEENRFIHDQALANELYARFWLDRGNQRIARLYLTEARFCYEQQGALAKIRDLEERHPTLLVYTLTAPSDGVQPHVSTHETTATALDFMAVLKAAQAISGEIVLDTLLEQLLYIVIEHAGAQKGFLIVEKDGLLVIEVAGSVEQNEITIRRAITLDSSQQLSLAAVNYVKRTSESLVIGDAENDNRFANDPYVAKYKPKSILCLPILSHGKLTEILYLENNLATNAFTPDRIEIMQILSAQAAISLENARLYNEMTQEMANRMRAEQALRQLNAQLEDYSRNLEQKVVLRTREIEQRRQVAESLRDILTILNSNRSLTDILDHIVAEASRLLGSDTSIIYRLHDPEQRVFTIQTMRGVSAKGLMNGNSPTELTQAILKGQPVAISDVTAAWSNSPALNLPSRTLARLTGDCRALLTVPLLVANEVYGCLLLCYTNAREFSAEEIELAVAFGDQAALAIENARLRQRIEQAAVLEERGRLARELHDSVTQSLYSLTLLAEGWRRLVRTDKPANIEDGLAELGGIAQQALKEMRLLVYELRPLSLEQEGLIGALQQRLKSVEQRAGLEAHLFADNGIELSASIEAGLYRIAQEALNNTLKHTTATSVKVYLRTDEKRVVLEVVDNGHGFDANAAGSRGGFGLISMQERAEKLGGRLMIDSILGVGTTVKVELSRNTTEVAG